MVALRRSTFTIVALITAFGFFSSRPQQAKTEKPDPIARLLELPAPSATPVKKELDAWEQQSPLPIPADDAPLKHLIKYWTQYPPRLASPTEVISRRLLEAVEQNHDLLPSLVDYLPDTPESHERVKALFDNRVPNEDEDNDWKEKYWQSKVHRWLMLHSRYFRDDLVQEASKVRESRPGEGDVGNEYYITALARLDWERVEPILAQLMRSSLPGQATFALSLQLSHFHFSMSMQ